MTTLLLNHADLVLSDPTQSLLRPLNLDMTEVENNDLAKGEEKDERKEEETNKGEEVDAMDLEEDPNKKEKEKEEGNEEKRGDEEEKEEEMAANEVPVAEPNIEGEKDEGGPGENEDGEDGPSKAGGEDGGKEGGKESGGKETQFDKRVTRGMKTTEIQQKRIAMVAAIMKKRDMKKLDHLDLTGQLELLRVVFGVEKEEKDDFLRAEKQRLAKEADERRLKALTEVPVTSS